MLGLNVAITIALVALYPPEKSDAAVFSRWHFNETTSAAETVAARPDGTNALLRVRCDVTNGMGFVTPEYQLHLPRARRSSGAEIDKLSFQKASVEITAGHKVTLFPIRQITISEEPIVGHDSFIFDLDNGALPGGLTPINASFISLLKLSAQVKIMFVDHGKAQYYLFGGEGAAVALAKTFCG